MKQFQIKIKTTNHCDKEEILRLLRAQDDSAEKQ